MSWSWSWSWFWSLFNPRRARLVISALSMLGLALPFQALAAAPPAEQEAAGSARGARFVPNEVLIQYRDGASEIEKASARARANAVKKERLKLLRSGGKGELELAATAAPVDEAIRELESHPAVVFAEPNWIYTHQATSNDPFYTNGSLWGMYGDDTNPANQYGSGAGEAWAAGHTGSGNVYVGVIDEGFQHTHPDLSPNVWTNPFDPPNGQDDDGNGYVDDLHGWDFFENNNSTYDGSTDDHGTHVTGTIGARGGNGTGVAGVNWNVTLISCKFLGPSGGSTSNAVKCTDYLTDLKTRHGLNIVASNNSWGGGGFSQSLRDAIQRANAANILYIAAAGNGGSDDVGDNTDVTPHYPASYTEPNVIAVASLTSSGARSNFSNFGPNSVDLGAPGSGIRSTVPTDNYANYSGTSMATPHVTGAAALYASLNPGASAAQIKSAILNNTTATASLAGKTVTGGRLDICKMLDLASCQPAPPPSGPVHVGDLDRSSAKSGFSRWKATVTITVHDANDNPLAGAAVSGAWGGTSGSGGCTTDANGRCSVTSGRIPNKTASVTFSVNGVTYPSLAYEAGANHDPDGDSTGTSITITKP